MAHSDDEKPRIDDEAHDEPEVVAHGILDDATLGSDWTCRIFNAD